jgi:hypothetical protein
MRLPEVIRSCGYDMSKPDEPRERASGKEKAELRVFRRIPSALERDHIDELAAALLEQSDPAWSEPGSHRSPKEK